MGNLLPIYIVEGNLVIVTIKGQYSFTWTDEELIQIFLSLFDVRDNTVTKEVFKCFLG